MAKSIWLDASKTPQAESSESRDEQAQPTGKRKGLMYTAVAAAVIVALALIPVLVGASLMGYSLINLGGMFSKYYTANKAYANLAQEYASPIAEDDFEDYESLLAAARERIIDFEGLHAINPEAVAWIFIPGTRIDYPVMHTDNNEFYLKHDFAKKPSDGGSIFLETVNTPDFTDVDSRIYGHNMYDRSMFGTLPDFRKEEFAATNDRLFIYMPGYTFEYAIVEQGLFADDGLPPITPVEDGPGFVTLVTTEYDFENARFFVRGQMISWHQYEYANSEYLDLLYGDNANTMRENGK